MQTVTPTVPRLRALLQRAATAPQRLALRARIAYATWELNCATDWMYRINLEGIPTDEELENAWRDAEAKRVRIAILEADLRRLQP